MKLLRRIFDFYIDASVHVALAVFALIQVTGETFNILGLEHLAYFTFFATISCYNFMKYGVEAEKYLVVAKPYHRSIQFLSFFTLGLAMYHASFLSLKTLIGAFCLLLLTGVYALPVLPNSQNLRSLGGLKIFIVALVWAGATVILPILYVEYKVLWDVYIEALQRFFLVLVLLVPFEIRDLAYDSPELKTLPQRFGSTNTKIIGAFGTLLFFFLTFLKDDIAINELIAKGVLFLILGMAMYMTRRNQNKYFASFWVEAIPIFWWILYEILEYYF